MQKTRAWPGIQYGHWFKLAWYGAVNMVCYVGMARSIGWHGGAATLWQYSGFECVKRRQVRASNQPNRHHGGSTIHYKAQSWGKARMDTAHKRPCSAQIACLTHLSYSCCIILLSTDIIAKSGESEFIDVISFTQKLYFYNILVV